MEILAVYLYGIYGSITATIAVVASVMIAVTITFSIIYIAQKSDYESNKHKTETNSYYKEAVPRYKASYENAKKFMFIKTSIFLVILNVLIPPKEIAVAMFAIKPAIQMAKDISDSNRTKNIVDILDLSIAKVKKNWKRI